VPLPIKRHTSLQTNDVSDESCDPFFHICRKIYPHPDFIYQGRIKVLSAQTTPMKMNDMWIRHVSAESQTTFGVCDD